MRLVLDLVRLKKKATIELLQDCGFEYFELNGSYLFILWNPHQHKEVTYKLLDEENGKEVKFHVFPESKIMRLNTFQRVQIMIGNKIIDTTLEMGPKPMTPTTRKSKRVYSLKSLIRVGSK